MDHVCHKLGKKYEHVILKADAHVRSRVSIMHVRSEGWPVQFHLTEETLNSAEYFFIDLYITKFITM